MWHGRGNSGGSWPPAFPALLNCEEIKYKRTLRAMQIKMSISIKNKK